MDKDNTATVIGWALGLAFWGVGANAADWADALSPIRGALGESKPIADIRLRYESVDQTPFSNDATAGTLRARIGFETGKAWSTSLLVEGVANVPVNGDFNSTSNGHTTFPVVADPENYVLNRLQLVNTSIRDTAVTLGRQRINLDDQRFVGNVGWRQNEQTLDALRMVNRSIPNVVVDFTIANQVNRIFGRDGLPGANTGTFHGNDVLLNLAWQSKIGRLTGFGYLVDIKEAPLPARDSTRTFGLRFAGDRPLARLKIGYVVSYATQQDYRDNPIAFHNDYYLGELTATYRQFNLSVGKEVLEGDGVKGFTTPLATLHRFQGWADKFLTTPVNGIEDLYLGAGYLKKGVGPFDTLGVSASWHKFDAQRLSIDYGDEFDLQLQAKYRRVTGTLKYADYAAASTTPLAQRDTRKLWAQADFTW